MYMLYTYNIDRRQYKWAIPVNILYLASYCLPTRMRRFLRKCIS